MKKSLVLGILSVAASVASSFGQGAIILDNYNTGGPNLVYGAGSGGTVGAPIANNSGWTVGLYFAPGSVLGAGSGNDIPSGPFLLASGLGSTAVLGGAPTGNTDGQFLAAAGFLIDPAGPLGGATFTIIVTAYNGADYATSLIRGHSAAVTIVTSAGNSTSPNQVGSVMSAFSVTPTVPIPEPATFALAGLGAAAMLIVRRRK